MQRPDIEGALARAEAATPGPWWAREDFLDSIRAPDESEEGELVAADVTHAGNRAFLVAARTDVPELAAYALALEEELAQLRGRASSMASSASERTKLAKTERERADAIEAENAKLRRALTVYARMPDVEREDERGWYARHALGLETSESGADDVFRRMAARSHGEYAVTLERECVKLRAVVEALKPYAEDRFPICISGETHDDRDKLAIYTLPLEGHGDVEKYWCADCGEPTGGVKTDEAPIVEALAALEGR